MSHKHGAAGRTVPFEIFAPMKWAGVDVNLV
jgi:hypothetical protein